MRLHQTEGQRLREQFIAAYNQFVTERPQGNSIDALQSVVADLRKEESDLAELLMQRLIPESAFRTEQRRIKTQIADCRAGKINKILVKSISRFARNTVDSLNYIRELRDLGLSVCFENENIDTMTPGVLLPI